MSTDRPTVFPSPDSSDSPGVPPRAPARRPSPWSRDDRLRERERRTRVRSTLLERLPPPDAPPLGDLGSFRVDLWPPRPPRMPRIPPRGPGAAAVGWTEEKLLDRVRTFAASRGPDFTMQEFVRWARITSNTLYKYCGTWAETRVAAGLPAEPTSSDLEVKSLHALLYTLHLNRRRSRPLTGEQLARAARMSVGPIRGFGGVKQVRNLYRLWVEMHPKNEE
ncbi:homing endonuclease associated repeat-containing protein [Alienimonas chondri]|uniref:Uncharacterized protein n=1 Tax=Alienimonas chondri TaxID=2681879 RepID=A0ABX1VH10_9PLAN|nr:hypothetical protein [Alienimonas chondri]NNJ27387.1 hypothetical protein [Alienimonas chondri]